MSIQTSVHFQHIDYSYNPQEGFRLDSKFTINGKRESEFNVSPKRSSRAEDYCLDYPEAIATTFEHATVLFKSEAVLVDMGDGRFKRPSNKQEELLVRIASAVMRALWVEAVSHGESMTSHAVPDGYAHHVQRLLDGHHPREVLGDAAYEAVSML